MVFYSKIAGKIIGSFSEKDVAYSMQEYFNKAFRTIREEKGLIRANIFCIYQLFIMTFSLILENLTWSFNMFGNYFKTTFRNIRKNKVFSFINIAGLALGMSISILFILYVVNELTYDWCHKKADNIYRLASIIKIGGRENEGPVQSAPLGPELVKRFPEVINSVRLENIGSGIISYKNLLFNETGLFYAEQSLFDIFTIDILQGEPDNLLQAPYTLVITEETARKYFGDENPLGKILKLNNNEDYTVTGVIKKMPSNTHLQFNMLFSFQTLYETRPDINGWMRTSYYTYLELKPGTPIEGLDEKYTNLVHEFTGELLKKYNVNLNIYLQPLKRIHLFSKLNAEMEPPGNITYIWIFSSISVFILLIACFNFMNLATARSAKRAREVGMRKVLGAFKNRIVFQFLGESVFLSFISLVVAMILIRLMLPLFNQLINEQLSYNIFHDLGISIGLIGLTLLTGFASGIYPAFFLSSFKPVEVLSSRLKSGRIHHYFRNVLVVFQFIISIVLICATIIIYFQMNYVKNYNLGFNKDNVAGFPLRGNLAAGRDVFKSEILRVPGVLNASIVSHVPGRGTGRMTGFFEESNTDNAVIFNFLEIDEDFLKTFGITLSSGRNFSKEFTADPTSSILINETLAKHIGWKDPLGKRVRIREYLNEQIVENTYTVIGVVNDFFTHSLRQPISPVILKMTRSEEFHGYIAVRLKPGNTSETLNSVKNIWKKHEPAFPYQYYFTDDIFDRLYRTEQRLGKMFVYFALFSIFIACLGLFGLISYIAENRTKEIGIRKVLGSTVPGVVLMLLKPLIKWVLIANIAAWPVVYYAMNKWLQEFAYRTDLGILPFILSGVIALLIAVLTVSYQSIKAAVANPVDSLRWE